MAAVGEALEEGHGFLDEVFALLEGLFDLNEVAGFGGGDGEGFGGVDHEDGEFELEFRVLCFFGVGAVELEGALVGEEGGVFSGAEVGMVEDGTGGGW